MPLNTPTNREPKSELLHPETIATATIAKLLRDRVPELVPTGPVAPQMLATAAREWGARAFKLYGDREMSPLGERIARALEAGSATNALELANALDVAIQRAQQPPAAPKAPAAWVELGEELGFEATPDGFSTRTGIAVALAVADQAAGRFVELFMKGVVTDELRRLRYQLAGRMLPPVRAGSVFEADRDALCPPLEKPVARSWGVNELKPQWLIDIATAFGVTSTDSRGGVTLSEPDRTGLLVPRIDAVIATVEKTRPGSLEASWLRKLRAYVADARAVNGQPEPTEALRACRALGVIVPPADAKHGALTSSTAITKR